MKTQLDNFDHKIIQALTGNARISITDAIKSDLL